MQFATASEDPPKPVCRKALLQTFTAVSEIEAAVAGYFRGPERDGGRQQFEIIEEIFAHPSYKAALAQKDPLRTVFLLSLFEYSGNQRFYRESYRLIEANPFKGSNIVLSLIKLNLLPEPIPAPETFQIEVFQSPRAVERDSHEKLAKLLDGDGNLPFASFIRRLLAYLVAHPDLTRDHKYCFALNLIHEYNRLRTQAKFTNEHLFWPNIYTLPVADGTRELMPTSGPRFICADQSCSHYFAITRGGKFFYAKKKDSVKVFDPSTWQDDAEYMHEAVDTGW